MSDSNVIELGDREYTLVPQRIGRISRKLGAIAEMFQGQAEGTSVGDVGPQLYDALKVFIPDLDPLWKLRGYASAEAAEADEYDEAADKSPTPPQLIDAIDAIFRIHGGERLVRLLKNVVGPEILRAVVRNEYVQRRTPSPNSPSSPQPNGGSALMTSTPTSPIPTPQESEASPLSASLAS
jgi:hypothetical protein